MELKWLQNGSLEASGAALERSWRQLATKIAPGASPSDSWSAPGSSWGRLGVVLGALGPLLGPPGPLLGVILASWGSLLELFWPLFSVPLKKRRNLEIRQPSHTKSLFFRSQGLPTWLPNQAKIDPGGFRKMF